MRGSPQPQSVPSTIPSESAATATVTRTTPTGSGSRVAESSRASRSSRRPASQATTPIGTFTRNTQRQSTRSTMTPPSDGPLAAATAPTAPHTPTAVARIVGGNSARTSASEAGSISEAPIAWTARAAISTPSVGAAPQMAEAAQKTSRPAKKIRRRPTRSATRPDESSSEANTMLYAFSTHESVASEAVGKLRRMAGNAMFAIVPSRKTM